MLSPLRTHKKGTVPCTVCGHTSAFCRYSQSITYCFKCNTETKVSKLDG